MLILMIVTVVIIAVEISAFRRYHDETDLYVLMTAALVLLVELAYMVGRR